MRLKWFLVGVVATLIGLSAAAYVYLEEGFVDARADAEPGVLEDWIGTAMDASTRRHAPKVTSPVPDNQSTLLAAAQVYGSRCMVCHGGPNGKVSQLGESFSPPAPQFFGKQPPEMMENENFYIIKHGVRMTAMPAWDKMLSDQQIWETVLLLKHIDEKTVPPDAGQVLEKQER